MSIPDDPSAPRAPGENTAPFGFRDVERDRKAGLVRGVFDRVADRYDLMNDLMSGGVHRIWKDMTIAKANPQPGERLIDVAGGTGDLARRWVRVGGRAAKRRGGPAPTAVVCDVNHEMLKAGRVRANDESSWVCGDAEQLPFPDRVADCVIIGFGIRNVTDRAAALGEMRRVLRPGGRFVCLEFSRPTTAALDALYDAWSFRVIPEIGRLAARDAESYQYLVESIRRFPDQTAFAEEVEAAGFARVSVSNYSGGVAAAHMGWRL